MTPHRSAIHRFVSEAANDLGDKEADALLDTLVDMNDDERRLALRAAWARSRSEGEAEKGRKGWWEQAASSLGRFATADSSFEENSVLAVSTRPGSVSTTVPRITDAAEARRFVDEQAQRHQAQAFASRMASGTAVVGYVPVPGGVSRELSVEESALVAEAKERALRKIDVRREIRAMSHTASPNDSVTASTVGTSVGIAGMMLATRGAGTPLLVELYAANNYEQLRLEYPQMRREDARAIALVAGGVEALPDMVNLKVLSALPSVKALLQGGLKRELVKRFVMRGAGVAAYENVQEGVQDLTLPAVQSLFAALQQDVPEVQWLGEGGEWEKFWQERPKVALGLGPLLLLGYGRATVDDIANARALLEDEVTLGALGVPAADRVKIEELAGEGRVDEAAQALREAWPRRSAEEAAPFQRQWEQQQQAGPHKSGGSTSASNQQRADALAEEARRAILTTDEKQDGDPNSRRAGEVARRTASGLIGANAQASFAWKSRVSRELLQQRELGRLAQAAQPRTAELLPGERLGGGNEHHVYRVDGSTVRKITQAADHGPYGQVVAANKPNGQLDFKPALPSDYIWRLALMRRVFNVPTRVVAIVQNNERPWLPQIVTEQPYYQSAVLPDGTEDLPTEDDTRVFLESRGFVELPKSFYDSTSIPDSKRPWYRASDHILVADAKPENFVKIALDEHRTALMPVDLIIQQMSPDDLPQNLMRIPSAEASPDERNEDKR